MKIGNDSVSENSHINSDINTTPLQGTESLRGHQVTVSSTTITQTTTIISQQMKKMTIEGLDSHQDRECEFSISNPNPKEVSKIKSMLTYPDSSQNYSTSNQVAQSSFNQVAISSDEEDDDFADFDELDEQNDYKALQKNEEEVLSVKEEVLSAKEEVITTTNEVMTTIKINDGIEKIQIEIRETTSIQITETVQKFLVDIQGDGYIFSDKEAVRETMHDRFCGIAASIPDFSTKGFNPEEIGYVVKMTFHDYKHSISKNGLDGNPKKLSFEDLEELQNKATEYLFNAFVILGLAFLDNLTTKKKEEKEENILGEPTVFSVSPLPPKTDMKEDIKKEIIILETFKKITQTEIQIQESIQRATKRKWTEDKEVLQEEIKSDVKKTEIKHYAIKQDGIKQDALVTRTLALEIMKKETFISSAVLVRSA